MSLLEAISPTARALLDESMIAGRKVHLARLRELDARLAACQSMEAEAQVQQLIEAENNRWATVQQTEEHEK